MSPSVDFYRFAAGNWLKANPVPADKSRWSGFDQLQQRNWMLIKQLLEDNASVTGVSDRSPKRQVANFFLSVMDTNRLERLGSKPVSKDLEQINKLRSQKALFALLADFHERGIGGLFAAGVSPDAKNSSVYAFELNQGGLGLPDRDYYLKDDFSKQRAAYVLHVSRMFEMIGESPTQAATDSKLVLDIETELAKPSRSRVDLRDPLKNYNKRTVAALQAKCPNSGWLAYFKGVGLAHLPDVIVGQPEFFEALDKALQARPLSEWKTYLRWHLIHSTAAYLNKAAETENFAFYGTQLRGQPEQEPRWQRAAKIIDGNIGEALGQLYVEKYFPASARDRMRELVTNLREVFHDRLTKVDWMSAATRSKALAKFDRFTQKIGHPETFKDYSKIRIRSDDLLGNVQRASQFESRREAARVGKAVDRLEWRMTPQTVNAYFNPLQNEIVFPAGILQPPFFDLEADDAVNYGAIGVVIGHEITHGYDDQGRQFDADGNLKDWWDQSDAKQFEARAQKMVDQYAGYEALKGANVNGRLTLGENLADLAGTTIAFEALQRALAKNPVSRKSIDGFTPEQRFFLSLAQLWRTNWREAELRRRLVVDPHSPGQFRAIGAHVNLTEFYEAFGIKQGAPMWLAPELRTKIW